MALVGMASKPLHVRRLQKSLHEWAMNPAVFQAPLSHLGKAPLNFLKTNLQPNLFFFIIPNSRLPTIQQRIQPRTHHPIAKPVQSLVQPNRRQQQ